MKIGKGTLELWQRNLYILWFTQIISLMSFGFGIPFIPFYLKELGVTDPTMLKTLTAVTGAAPALTMAIMAPIWGILSDKYGRKPMILRAMFMASILIGGMGLVQNHWQFLILRLLQGVFTGTITATSAFIAANTPDTRLSYALGFMSSSNFLGYSIGPFVGSIFANAFGYRFSFLFGGGLMLIGGLLVLFQIKEDKGSFGVKKNIYRGFSGFGEFLTPFLICMLVSLFLLRINRSVFAPYLPLFIEEQVSDVRLATTLTGVINGIVGAMTAASGIFFGKLGDKRSKLKMIRVLLLGGILMGAFSAYIPNFYGFIVSYGLFYFLVGGIEPIVTAMAAEKTSPEKRGMLFGFQGFVSSMGWIVSPFIGAVVSVQMGIHQILFVLPLVLLLNYVLVIWMLGRGKKQAISNGGTEK